ncbi:hypothetical protein GJV26_16945 [Massilia dura]|uniref:Uncharacterized protein n=1 Tax=Pseudoduganella dura TaxID=321982 RepID=A0A6I3XKG7_9BURK|nr:hypothetical protein [Pseudoduganella dura]MUI14131.1 hypothetical protein [Pseudoduganella dura]GGX76885.1 hypothetical protein GCM10007386_05110 [Pseudoduganella dura]
MAETTKKRPQRFTAAYVEKVQKQHEADRNKWAFYIGHIVLTFTEIEDLTLDTIEWFSPSFHEFSKTLLLEKRLELLSTILDSHDDLSDDSKLAFNNSIKRVRKLASKRNLIVHNSVRLIFTTDSDSVILSAGGLISSARNEEIKMNLQQLIDFLDESRNCYIELFNAKNKAHAQIRNAQSIRHKQEHRRQSAALRRARKKIEIES